MPPLHLPRQGPHHLRLRNGFLLRDLTSLPSAAPVVLLGPTGSGKTDLVLRLCRPEFHTVINADSQQVYRDLVIGTAAPRREATGPIPHRLFAFVPAGERMSAGRFAELVDHELRRTLDEGRIPVLVGGSGLYLHGILFGLDDLPEADPELRRRLEEEADRQGLSALYGRLQSIDPEYAAVISPTDRVRIVRALEIWILSGRRLGDLRRRPKRLRYPGTVIAGLRVERGLLYETINRRCEAMLEGGWIEEVRTLVGRGFRDWLREIPAIGYGHILDHLEGRIDRQRLLELIRRDTRRYAKRQITWFRKTPGVRWFDHVPGTVPDGLAGLFTPPS